jgi:hypothetical protein
MSLVTFHINISYNTTTDTIAVLVCQVRRSVRVSKHCVMQFVTYFCYWHFNENAINKHFKILNTFLFCFYSIMNEINIVTMLYISTLTKLNIVPLKFNACWKFHLHKYAITLFVLKIIFSYLCFICMTVVLISACYLHFSISIST